MDSSKNQQNPNDPQPIIQNQQPTSVNNDQSAQQPLQGPVQQPPIPQGPVVYSDATLNAYNIEQDNKHRRFVSVVIIVAAVCILLFFGALFVGYRSLSKSGWDSSDEYSDTIEIPPGSKEQTYMSADKKQQTTDALNGVATLEELEVAFHKNVSSVMKPVTGFDLSGNGLCVSEVSYKTYVPDTKFGNGLILTDDRIADAKSGAIKIVDELSTLPIEWWGYIMPLNCYGLVASSQTVGDVSVKGSGGVLINLLPIDFKPKTFHHESFHVFETQYYGFTGEKIDDWPTSDDVYLNSNDVFNVPRKEGFVSQYAYMSAKEDRAETFAAIMYPDVFEDTSGDELVQQKKRKIIEYITRHYPGMEQYLKSKQ